MVSPAIQQELQSLLDRVSPEHQRRVLEYARSLVAEQGVSGSDVLRFAGLIETDDSADMQAAIEAGCERVESDEW